MISILLTIYTNLRREKMVKWHRCLPFSELLVDRWEKARFLGFGSRTSIYDNSYVFGDVKIGENTWIGPFTILDGAGGLEIGDNCSISSGVHVYSHNTVKWAVSQGKAPYEYDKTTIGNHCFIGPQSVIKSGVTIGDHSVVGACSFVNKSFPSHSIVGGNPAKLIGKVVVSEDASVSFEYLREPVTKGLVDGTQL